MVRALAVSDEVVDGPRRVSGLRGVDLIIGGTRVVNVVGRKVLEL
jgi:hypothetical protein